MGSTRVFGLPGAQLYPLFDALQQRSDRVRTIGARHEQACGYMAFGYARSTGRPGVFAVVPGPGILNTSAACARPRDAARPCCALPGRYRRRFSAAAAAICTSCPISSRPCAR